MMRAMAVRRAGILGSLVLVSMLAVSVPVAGASAPAADGDGRGGGSAATADGSIPATDESFPAGGGSIHPWDPPARAVRTEADPFTVELPPWTGGLDLYRRGSFSTQRTWRWCTAAVVQIVRNIHRGERDRSRRSQQRYFSYMRAHDHYDIPLADGVDPAGWAAGMRRWIDPSYRVVARETFAGALRSAVTSLRTTNLPVAIAVAHGMHAWVLTGFRATADPAATDQFKVTSVRVVGPLWGLQSRAYGYDMKPDKRLTRDQLRGFFTRWHYPRVAMTWEGRWVAIQPILP